MVDLELGMETMQLDDIQPRYKHLKHEASKVLIGCKETSKKEGKQVPLQFSNKVMKFVSGIEEKE